MGSVCVKRFLALALLFCNSAAFGYTPAAMPTNTALQGAATITYPGGLWRDTFGNGNGAPPLFYRPSNAACTLNAGNGDNGGQVKSADGKCWLAVFPNGVADVREWGAIGDGVTNNTTAIQAAVNYAIGYAGGLALAVPPGTFMHNTVTVEGLNLRIQGAGKDKTVFKPLTSGTVPWQIGNPSDPNPWFGTFHWTTGGIYFKDLTFDSTGKAIADVQLAPSAQQVTFDTINFVGDVASYTLVDDLSDEPTYLNDNWYCTNNTSWALVFDTWGHNQHITGGLIQGGSAGFGSGCSGFLIKQGLYSPLSTGITSLTLSGTTATATTATAIPPAMYVGVVLRGTVSGATQAAYNGTFAMTITGTNTFTYYVGGSPPSPATGTITAVLDPAATIHRVEGVTIDGHTTFLSSGPNVLEIGNSLSTTAIGAIFDQIPVNGNGVYITSGADDVKLIGNWYGGAGTISNQIGVFVNNTAGVGTQIIGGTCWNTNFCVATGGVTGAGPAVSDLYIAGLHSNFTVTQMGYFDSVGKLTLMGNVDDGGNPANASTIPANGTFGTAQTAQHSTIIACGNMMTANNPVPYDATASYHTCANVGPAGFWGN